MKISISTSLWSYCSYALKWTAGKVLLRKQPKENTRGDRVSIKQLDYELEISIAIAR